MNEIVITATSAITIAGNRPDEILNNIINYSCCPVLNRELFGSAPGESKQYPIYIANIPKYGNHEPEERIIDLITLSLKNLQNHFTENLNLQKTLIHTVIPPENSARSKYFDKNLLRSVISNIFSDVRLSFSSQDHGVCKQLHMLGEKLHNNEYQAIIFGSVDSLVNTETIQEFNKQNNLMTTFCTQGIAPGEAAVYILLQKKSGNNITIKSIEQTIGLCDAIQTALNDAELTPKDIDNTILSLGAMQNDPLEWNQTMQTIWPFHTYPNLPKQIFTFTTVGEIGAATVPLQLILATVLSGTSLICEANEHSPRGAIIIQNGEKSCNKISQH